MKFWDVYIDTIVYVSAVALALFTLLFAFLVIAGFVIAFAKIGSRNNDVEE